MKKIFFTTLLLLFFTSFVSAKTHYVNENITDITPKINDTVILILPENPSTGYQWEMLCSDETIIKILKNTYIKPKTNMPGTPGQREYKFKIDDYGNTIIMGAYVRPWEKDKVTKTYTLNITVE